MAKPPDMPRIIHRWQRKLMAQHHRKVSSSEAKLQWVLEVSDYEDRVRDTRPKPRKSKRRF